MMWSSLRGAIALGMMSYLIWIMASGLGFLEGLQQGRVQGLEEAQQAAVDQLGTLIKTSEMDTPTGHLRCSIYRGDSTSKIMCEGPLAISEVK